MSVSLSVPQAALLLGIPFRTLDSWITGGIVPASPGHRGRQRDRRITAVGLLTAAVIRQLRNAGADMGSVVRPAATFLAEQSEASLNAAFRRGKSRLVCAAGRSPQLVSVRYRPSSTKSSAFLVDVPIEHLYRSLSVAVEKEVHNAD